MAVTGLTTYVPRPYVKNQDVGKYLTEELRRISAAITTQLQALSGQLPLGTYTVTTLPVGGNGKFAVVSDGAASISPGSTVTGGGSTTYLVFYKASAWKVVV